MRSLSFAAPHRVPHTPNWRWKLGNEQSPRRVALPLPLGPLSNLPAHRKIKIQSKLYNGCYTVNKI
jgi:hypothetical protein